MSGLWVVCVLVALCSVAVSQTFYLDDEDCDYDSGSGSGGFDPVHTDETDRVDVPATKPQAVQPKSTVKESTADDNDVPTTWTEPMSIKSTVKDVYQDRIMAPDTTESPSGKDKSWALLVGVPVGVAALLVCVIIIVAVVLLKHKRRPDVVTEKTIEEETKVKAENAGNEYVEVKVETTENEYAEVYFA